LERAAEPIDGPGHDHPEAPTRGIFAKRIEGWSVLSRLCPAYAFVAIELDNLPTHAFGDLAKFAFLVLGGLVVGGNTGVNRNGSHGARAVEALAGEHHAVLLANHGPVVAGTSLESAQYATEELEETAKLFLMLRGEKIRPLTLAQVEDLRARYNLR
jgi:hypothetical protein